MSLLSNLFKTEPDPREALRPLWHRVVALSRDRALYRDLGVADTVAGRFDMIVAVLALVLLRLETGGRAEESTLLTELFVADMDAQLRETGVGDVVVGKHMGKLMAALGGRMGALRAALASADSSALADALERNVTWRDGAGPEPLARRLRGFADTLAAIDDTAVLAGRFVL